ncbi:MAG TPA: 16S rRNA (cytosine(1402)-N(4))-methyltransferase RsmH [Polyangiaceae bacterium]
MSRNVATASLAFDSQLALPGLGDEWIWAEEEEFVVESFHHATVMKSEVVEALSVTDGGVYVDATLGGGGHAEAILEAAPGARVIGFDRDLTAIQAATGRLARFGERFVAIHEPFARARQELLARGIDKVQGLCADLGISSPQIDDPLRGMSFRHEGPIDMRMDTTRGETALELIDRLSDDELADVLFQLGEERRSRRIARSIHRAHNEGELRTTADLRRAIVRAVGPVRVGGVDPATRSFQALRIAVNQELEELDALLAVLPEVLEPGGVAAIISFHSLEDRRVKRAFHQRDLWAPLTKKPRIATDDELALNPRARSAKLRAARLLSPQDEVDETDEEDDG